MKITDNAKILGFLLLLVSTVFCNLISSHLLIIFILIIIGSKKVLEIVLDNKFLLLIFIILSIAFGMKVVTILKTLEIITYIILVKNSTNFYNFEKGLESFLSIFQRFINVNFIAISTALTIKYFSNTISNFKNNSLIDKKGIDFSVLSNFKKIRYHIINAATSQSRSIKNTDNIIDAYDINHYDLTKVNKINFNTKSLLFILLHIFILVLLLRNEAIL